MHWYRYEHVNIRQEAGVEQLASHDLTHVTCQSAEMMVLEVMHDDCHVGIGCIEEMSGTPLIRNEPGKPLLHGIVRTTVVRRAGEFAQA